MKTVGTMILLSLITTTMINAGTHNHSERKNTFSDECNKIHAGYQTMSTIQLQQEVEKHSKNRNLSFLLGQELIKRWTKS